MITFEVTTTVEPDLVPAWVAFMRTRHIPDVLATGCFRGAAFALGEDGRYRTRYEAADQDALDRYRTEHSSRLRADVAEHFPRGLTIGREIWTVLEHWPAGERP